MSDNIKVVVKVRPLIPREVEDKLFYQWRIENDTLYQVDQNGKDAGPSFTFDKVYDKDTKTSDVYNDIAKPIVEAATAGFNGTIFAYGQTSSGKTYTMTGTEEAPGIIQLAVINLFKIIQSIPNRDFLVRVSYVEIYNETLIDLLNNDKKNIKIHDTLQGVKVDATEKVTTSPDEVLDAMKEGKANRQTGSTNMNDESSRSHSIFQITIESREHIEGEEEAGCVNVSQLNLVDLAGSERAGQTGATGLRFKEGTHINKSLSSLALVIKQLSDDPSKHVNYRDSKLTRILQNSLGGNAKTSIICAVTPAAVEETISTLQFANRAKAIKNKPAVNAVATNATMIQKLTKQLSSLKTQLETKKTVEQDNYNLQKQIAALQRLILNGFGQRSTAEILNPRRKLVQPRRITISTLHPIQEDPVPAIPKFCTPSLKYNPLCMPGALDFAPIKSAASLNSLPEEPPRLITPPPRDKKVYFENEIIELDSDDDCSADQQTCSPYHKCYDSSKTPPCILRKNAKQAEKNFQDIVELTEREKIYMPSVVELMEKLEQNASVIAKLEDEINKLNLLSKEKESEMDYLKSKISQAEENIKMVNLAKLELETLCQDYSIKLTDSEVSLETLKKKAKSREDELLSLLEEQAPKKTQKIIGKNSPNIKANAEVSLLEESQVISLVSSDNEQSIVNAEGDTLSQPAPDLVTDLQAQLIIKDQKILELEAIIFTHEQKISSLENISQDYQSMLDSYKEKLSSIENQIPVHKSTIDSLKTIIEARDETIDSVNADIESYKTLIQELQIKLRTKGNVNIDIDDTELENLIASEDNFIANNENINNIIQSFRNTLCIKNKEIKTLRETIEQSGSLKDNHTKELDHKNMEITTLTEQIHQLKIQSEGKIVTINKLLVEQNNRIEIEKQLTSKVTEIENYNSDLTKDNEILLNRVKEYKDISEELKTALELKEQELVSSQNYHTKELENMSSKIDNLEKDNMLKDNIIAKINKEDEETQENLSKAKLAVQKVQNIISVLNGNIKNVPDMIDNFVVAFDTLSNNLGTLENIANIMSSQKKEIIATLKCCEKQYISLKGQIDSIIEALDKTALEKLDFVQQSSSVNKNDDIPDNVEIFENVEMQSILIENQSTYNTLKDRLNNLFHTLITNQSEYQRQSESKEKEIVEIKHHLQDIQSQLENKTKELLVAREEIKDVVKKRDQLLHNILNKTTNLTLEFNIENSVSCEFGDDEDNTYEEIILTLDKIANHIDLMKNKNEHDNLEEVLLEAKKEIRVLTEQNLKFMNDISRIESTNCDLSQELDKIRQENKNLMLDLENSSEVLDRLRQELNAKLEEMDSIESKAKEWKDQFINLDFLVKEQMHALRMENTDLKSRYFESLRMEDKYSKVRYEFDTNNEDTSFRRPISNDAELELKSPQSLLTLCCNRIIDAIQVNEDKVNSINPSSANSDILINDLIYDEQQRIKCQCDKLENNLKNLIEENSELKVTIEKLKTRNNNLLKEQREIENEVKSLVEFNLELNKRIVNHKTILSTLTATTYAENKSLSSQIKSLQHYHSRFYNVCQRDIPAFKKQLQDLLTLLRTEDSLKRYSLPNALDCTTTLSNFKNESTLDGDLLMLDTNLTITTTGDTTLIGHDQTCFDVTQVTVYNEVACQTADIGPIIDINLLNSQIGFSPNENIEILEKFKEIQNENNKLREVVDEYLLKKSHKVDMLTSPIKLEGNVDQGVSETIDYTDLLITQENNLKEIELLTQKLTEIESEKADILEKYNNLLLEIPATDALVTKFKILEKEHSSKLTELEKVKNLLSNKTTDMVNLQYENDNFSTQVIELISEVDNLKKEHDNLKANNTQLTTNITELQNKIEVLSKNPETLPVDCPQCISKNDLIISLEKKLAEESHVRLSRSFSDSDRSSRYNTICTLQSELHAGKEDCNKLKEEVTTIKNHLDRSNLSAMDLDDSMGEPNIYSYTKDFDSVDTKCTMPDIPEERPLDMYALDKGDCFNYYVEITGTEKKDLNLDVKIIDVMKMFYNNVLAKHGNEVENLINKLRDFEDSKRELQNQLENLVKQNSDKTKELQEKERSLEAIAKIFCQIKDNISNTFNLQDSVNYDFASNFQETILKPLDIEFGLNSGDAFKTVLEFLENKYKHALDEKSNQCLKLQDNLQNLRAEISTVCSNLSQLKSQLTEKENEFSLLKKQKERIQEISNAVTLDIVKKEQDLNKIVKQGYKKLIENKILTERDDNPIIPLFNAIDEIFELIIKQHNHKDVSLTEEQKNSLNLETNNLKTILEEKNNEVQSLNYILLEKENELQTQKILLKDLHEVYDKKVKENDANIAVISKIGEEINILKESIITKEQIIQTLQNNRCTEKQNKISEEIYSQLLNNKNILENEVANLKVINQEILNDKNVYAKQLEESSIVIKQHKKDMESLTSDIIILKESVKENVNIIETLKQESKSLLEQNSHLKEQLQEKSQACSRLEMNIKTHEKTAEIQSRMIMRLQKQKEEYDNKDKQIEELMHKCAALQKECDTLSHDCKISKEQVELLKKSKQSLEVQISELQSEMREAHKPRVSLDAAADVTRRRRQSIHDSKRMFAEDDHNKMEALFGSRTKAEDLFMEVDDCESSRSTPLRQSKGRDSSQFKHEQSDKDEEVPSRPSSVLAARRRRQSVHDLHRSALSQTPSPHDHPRKLSDLEDIDKFDSKHGDSEVSQLKQRLAACTEELEDLREKYRELDDECETCALYLRERDDHCARLKRDKLALENTVSELKAKLQNPYMDRSSTKCSYSDAAVNTDEDWANLHSVVVDRMSYNAEVEKNKKLTKTIEDLRFKKQDLKTTLAKMQKALEKKSSHDRELEVVKAELKSCRQELEELKERYRELDEECETCGEYLRERDDQCRKLKEAKIMLEAKLAEYEADASSITHSVRKKRQSQHDQNRLSATVELVDAATETSEGYLSYQVEKDNSRRTPDNAQMKELKRLRVFVDRLSQQKASLEQQLAATSAPAPLYVATGSAIVQNQQLTDVMKENQKLKKMNAKLITICKKRGKTLSESNRENQDPSEHV